MNRVNEPEFTVLGSDGKVEFREYSPKIVAEAKVTGERSKALKVGYDLIYAYTVGANGAAQKIAINPPIIQQFVEKFYAGAVLNKRNIKDVWMVRCAMPVASTLETLPEPTDNRVELISVPSKCFAVIQFSGSQSDANINPQQDYLIAYARNYEVPTVGQPILAFYHPLWTFPFLKRNEVTVELKDLPILNRNQVMAEPTPSFKIESKPICKTLRRDGEFEIRAHLPTIMAEVELAGISRSSALVVAYHAIMNYIFGLNESKMLLVETSGVAGPFMQLGSDTHWKIQFILPEVDHLDSMPKPKNSLIKLVRVPFQLFACVRFPAGPWDDELLKSLHEKLLAYVRDRDLTAFGHPVLAHHPGGVWNRAMVELKEDQNTIKQAEFENPAGDR